MTNLKELKDKWLVAAAVNAEYNALKACDGVAPSRSGDDRAGSAADPDWWAQLETQLEAVHATIDLINDDDLVEAFEAFDTAYFCAKRRQLKLDQEP